MKFKKGDYVVSLRSLGGQFTKGNTYLVIEVYHRSNRIIVLNDDQGTINGWHEEFFTKSPKDLSRIDRLIYNI